MILHLSEKEATKLFLLVRHYANLLNSGTMPVNPETIEFYESLYDNIGVQIESHKRQSDNAEKALKECLNSLYGKDAAELHPEIYEGGENNG